MTRKTAKTGRSGQTGRDGALRPPTVTRPELLVDGSDASFRNLVYDTLAFFNRFEAVRDGYAAIIGITGIQYTILASILDLQDRQQVGVTTIAERLHLSVPFVTIETNKLVEQGLVEKLSDPNDGRRVILRTTDKAYDRLLKLSAIQRQVNDVNFEGMSRAEFKSLCAIMARLVSGTDRALTLLQHVAPADDRTATGAQSRAGKRARSKAARR